MSKRTSQTPSELTDDGKRALEVRFRRTRELYDLNEDLLAKERARHGAPSPAEPTISTALSCSTVGLEGSVPAMSRSSSTTPSANARNGWMISSRSSNDCATRRSEMTVMVDDEQIYRDMCGEATPEDLANVQRLTLAWADALDKLGRGNDVRTVFMACVNTIGTMGPAYCRDRRDDADAASEGSQIMTRTGMMAEAWEAFAEGLYQNPLAVRESHADLDDRSETMTKLNPHAQIATDDVAELCERLRKEGVPAGRVIS